MKWTYDFQICHKSIFLENGWKSVVENFVAKELLFSLEKVEKQKKEL